MKALLIILFFPFCIYGQSSLNQTAEWKTLTQSDYSIQYPSSWELNESGYLGTSFIILSPLERDEDQFMENVNLLIQDLQGQNIDLNKYTEISESQIKTIVSNSVLIESKRVKSGTDEYHRIIYSGDQGELHLKYEQYYRVKNDKAYVLTFTSDQSNFDKYQEVGEKILNSFNFKK